MAVYYTLKSNVQLVSSLVETVLLLLLLGAWNVHFLVHHAIDYPMATHGEERSYIRQELKNSGSTTL